MTHEIRVTSLDRTAADSPVSDYLALTDVELRRRKEPAEGIFIAEGEKVIRRALAAGYAPRSFLLSEKWLPSLADLLPQHEVPALVAHDEVLAELTGFEVHRGALASLARRPLPAARDVLAQSRRVAVLEDVNNHTNVGVVFRAAAALGMDAVLLSPRCADPLYRRAVKVSMGAVFAVPYARLEQWPTDLGEVRASGFTVLALTPAESAVALADVPTESLRRSALLFGAEGPGLTDAALAHADLAVRIPMARGVDSLNVGAAAAVAFYAVGSA